MTASMFDLSMKDKPRTPFGKLKDKIKGKKKYEMESASAIVPSSVGRLDSDEDDFHRESDKKPKSKGFFLKGKLRKSSLSGSNTSIRSNNSTSSAGGATNADLSILVPEMAKKPAHRNLSTDGYDNPASPRQTHKRAFSDEAGQLSSGAIPESKAVHNLKPKNSPVSKSSLCVNGSHVYTEELPPKTHMHVIEPFVMSRSLQNITKKPEDVAHVVPSSSRSEQPKVASSGPEKVVEVKVGFPATSTPEDAKVSSKIMVLNQPSSKAKMEEPHPEVKPVQIATPIILSVEPKKEKQHEEAKKEDKKPKVSLFHHGSGRSENGAKTFVEKIVPTQTTNSSQVSSNTDDRTKTSGWFGSKDHKDASHKPSLDVSPQVEPSSAAPPPHFSPCFPVQFSSATVAHSGSMPSTNLFAVAEEGLFGSLSPTNPFFDSLQSNPFLEDLIADKVLNSPSPTHFFCSFPSMPNATGGADEGLSSLEKSTPSSTTARPVKRIADLSDGDQAARPASDHSVNTESPPEMMLPWSDPFDAFATSRLLPENKEERLSTPVNICSKVDPCASPNAVSHGTPSIQTSTTVSLKSGLSQINRVVVKMNELPSPKNFPSVQDSLFSVPEKYVAKTFLSDMPKEPILMSMDNMVPSVPASYFDSSGKSVLSARVRTSEKLDILPQSIQKYSAEENFDSVTSLEMHTGQDESKLPARPLHEESNTSSKKLFVSQPEIDPNVQMKRVKSPNKLSDCKLPNLGELDTMNLLPVLSKSAEQSFSSIPANACFNSGSENKIAAISPLGLNKLNVERHQNAAPEVVYEGTGANKDRSQDHISNQDILSVVLADNENVSMAQNNELCTKEKVMYANTNDAEKGISLSFQDTSAHKNSRDTQRALGGTPGVGLQAVEVLVSPPKPPRCFTSAIEENKIEVNKQASSQNKRDRKPAEGPKDEMRDQNIRTNSEKFSLVPPCPLVSDVSGVQAEHLVMINVDSELDTEDLSSNLSKTVNEAIVRDTSNGQNMPATNEVTEPEQLKTCLLKFTPDSLDNPSVKVKSNKLDDVCSSTVEHQWEQLNQVPYPDKLGIVQSSHLSTEILAKEKKPPILEIPETIGEIQTGHSGLFLSAYEYLPQKNEDPYLAHTSQIKPQVQNETSSKYCTATEQTCLEAAQNEDLIQAIKQASKPQVPNVISVNSLVPSTDCTLGCNQPDITQELNSVDISSQQSSWSADMVVDFKNVDFWKSETVLGCSSTNPTTNPFVPQSPKNPFVETFGAVSNHAEVSIHEHPSSRKLNRKPPDLPPLNLHQQELKSSFLHDSQPLAFSTPFLMASANTQPLSLPSPIISPAAVVSPAATTQAAALSSCYTPLDSGGKSSSLAVLPQETQPAERLYLHPKSSPHPVKPISASVSESAERKQQKSSLSTAFNNGLEKLRTATTSSVQAVAPSVPGKPDNDRLKDPAFTDQAAKYYHLTHDELIHMLLQRENELSKKDEHVRALETYLDQLLVRIMDHAPTLLQVPLDQKKK